MGFIGDLLIEFGGIDNEPLMGAFGYGIDAVIGCNLKDQSPSVHLFQFNLDINRQARRCGRQMIQV